MVWSPKNAVRHEKVLLLFNLQIGGATGYIGDPSGRSSDRVALSSDVIANNVNSIRSNLEMVFENHKKYIWSQSEVKLKPVR